MTFPKSQEYFARGLKVTPGASQTGSKAPGRAGPLSDYPLFLCRGLGAHVWDVDGNEYLDLIASLAAVTLGHNEPHVANAVITALNNGSLLSLPTPDEVTTSERLVEFIGHPDWQVRWVKTGSEANEAAVRIARCATGRDKILTVRSGYHAWHSWFQAVKPQHPGVPQALTELIDPIDYGDYQKTVDALKRGIYAAVILEPAPITGGGDHSYLWVLIEEAHRHGTLVIFDEVVWGLRLSPSGGTGYFEQTPDLATYGKALANGLPIGAVVGPAGLMAHAQLVSGTFGGDRLALAAARVVMDIYREQNICAKLQNLGAQLELKLNGLGCEWFTSGGYPVHPVWTLAVPGVAPEVAMSAFVQQLARRGVLYHPAGGNIMACLTPHDIDRIAWAVRESLESIVTAVKTTGDLRDLLVGEPYQQAFARAR